MILLSLALMLLQENSTPNPNDRYKDGEELFKKLEERIKKSKTLATEFTVLLSHGTDFGDYAEVHLSIKEPNLGRLTVKARRQDKFFESWLRCDGTSMSIKTEGSSEAKTLAPPENLASPLKLAYLRGGLPGLEMLIVRLKRAPDATDVTCDPVKFLKLKNNRATRNWENHWDLSMDLDLEDPIPPGLNALSATSWFHSDIDPADLSIKKREISAANGEISQSFKERYQSYVLDKEIKADVFDLTDLKAGKPDKK